MNVDPTKRKRALVVINPIAGDGRSLRILPELIRALTEKGYVSTAVTTTHKGSATEFVSELARGFDMVVCSGGDGTANEVIRGLMTLPEEERPVFALIPCGSTNDLAITLNIPKLPKNAVEMILRAKTVPIDVGMFNNRHYAFTCAFGAFTTISYDTSQIAKNIFGPLAYVAKGLETMREIKPIHMRFRINGEEIDDRFAFGCISNSHVVGGVIRFKHKWVELNDGMFEILLIRYPEDSRGFSKIINAISSGELSCEYMRIYHAPEIEITLPDGEPIDFSLDGEKEEGVTHALVKNIRSGIRCIVNEKPETARPVNETFDPKVPYTVDAVTQYSEKINR